MGICGLCLKGVKSLLKSRSAAKTATQTATKTLKTSNKPLFCEEYWAWAKANGIVKNSDKTSVGMHGYLHSINHHFRLSAHPEHIDQVHFQTGKTVRNMIVESDMEFKALKPTTEPYVVYRAVGEKPDFFSTYKFYEKATQVKPGDKFVMNEYAYFTSDINYAKEYLVNGKGILYRMKVPSNAQVSRIGDIGNTDEFVFPRASKGICTNVSRVKDAESDYLLVDSEYVLPKML